MRRALPIVLLFACGPAFDEPSTPNNKPSLQPDPIATASGAPSSASSTESQEVQIGVGPPLASAETQIAPPDPQPQPQQQQKQEPRYTGAKPTILKQIDVGPQPTLLHGYSDCHLGAGAEVKCAGLVDVELLSRDQGPVTSAPSPKDITTKEPTKAKLFRQSLCHDFYVRLKSPKATKCDVALHAIIYPD